MNETEAIVPYNVALKLKEMGYTEPVCMYYVEGQPGRGVLSIKLSYLFFNMHERFRNEAHDMNKIKSKNGHYCISAPDYSEAIWWLNKKLVKKGYPGIVYDNFTKTNRETTDELMLWAMRTILFNQLQTTAPEVIEVTEDKPKQTEMAASTDKRVTDFDAKKCPFSTMKPGDSFLYPNDNKNTYLALQQNILYAARRYRQKSGKNWRFTTRSVENGVRTWRIK